MGTRGVFGFRCNGKDSLAYVQFDSYPSGMGEQIVQDIMGVEASLEVLKVAAGRVVLIPPRSSAPAPTAEQIELCRKANTIDLKVSNQSTNDWYCLVRGAQGTLEPYLREKNALPFMLSAEDFPGDSLFCEYGYVVNVDTGRLEFYRGFNSKEGEIGLRKFGRYWNTDKPDEDGEPSEFGGIFLVAEFTLGWLKKNHAKAVEEMDKQCLLCDGGNDRNDEKDPVKAKAWRPKLYSLSRKDVISIDEEMKEAEDAHIAERLGEV